MSADKSRILVTIGGATAGGSSVHHRDFPEIRAEGASPSDAAQQLINQLSRALDSALTIWRRETIQNAIDDVEAFAAQPT